MGFQPDAGQELEIDGVAYRVVEHPAAPGLPYGQEGRQAVVYQLAEGQERRALKVFKARYRVPGLVALADRLAPFAGLAGLAVCRRTVLTSSQHAALLRRYTDLTYAVLMPWIAGPTWLEMLVEHRALTPEASWTTARALARQLATMEEYGVAHCDLSGSNLILPPAAGRGLAPPGPALVDVEQMYGPGLDRPEVLPGGSLGYAHRTAPQGLWSSLADRFAGAVLLVELLGWCEAEVREAAWGESYFDPAEIGQATYRYRHLIAALREHWGPAVAALFERAWWSETLADCPTFGEWVVSLPEQVAAPGPPAAPADSSPDQAEAVVLALTGLAWEFDRQGNPAAALATYEYALRYAPLPGRLGHDLDAAVGQLYMRWPDLRNPQEESGPPAVTPSEPITRTNAARLVTQYLLDLSTPATGVAFAPDGQTLASGAEDGAIDLWAGGDGQYLGRLGLHEQAVRCLAFTPDGALLASAAADQTIRLWPLAGSAAPRVLRGHRGSVNSIAISRDGRQMLSGGQDGTCRLWQMSRGKQLARVGEHVVSVAAVAITPDGETFATGTTESLVRIWVPHGSRLVLRGHTDPIACLAFAPDGAELASGGADGTVRLWQWATTTCRRILPGHGGGVHSLAYTPDGALLIVGGADSLLRLWRVEDGVLLGTFTGHTGAILAVGVAPDGSRIASASHDGTIRVWAIA